MMADKILNIIWGALTIWTCLVPAGYGPYLLLGLSGGNFLLVLYCVLTDGYLRVEGDIKLESFLGSSLTFFLLGGFYAGGLSFTPGSDAYNNALLLFFLAFWLTFGYRYCQYRVIPYLKKLRAGS